MRQVFVYHGEDDFWVAECPSLPGCISQGKTKEDALACIREAIDLYIETLVEDGLIVPDERFDALLVRGVDMPKLPQISGKVCIRALERAGFRVRGQRGSHVILRRDDPFAQLVVTDHRRLDRGTLRAIIRQADMSVQEFLSLL